MPHPSVRQRPGLLVEHSAWGLRPLLMACRHHDKRPEERVRGRVHEE